MNNTALHYLAFLLIFLILVAAFFSAAEISMMSLNRYRLRHMSKNQQAAKRVSQLLERPDRFLGVVLIGNNFANILASAIATIIAVRLWGDFGVVIATILLTMIILIFAEIAPKTVAALYPEKIAFPSSLLLKVLLFVLYPIVWIVNGISNGLLKLFGVNLKRGGLETISHEELRTLLREATGKNLSAYQEMLISILDLQKVTVNDIMVPRSEIIGIDIDQPWEAILEQLTKSQHTRLPIYHDTIDHVQGILHVRRALNLAAENRLNKNSLLNAATDPYFIPTHTSLNIQLINFRHQKLRSALVVDEYGDILGLVTLEDILEEIVGEFTTNLIAASKPLVREKDGSYLVDASLTVREINRLKHWELPTTGPKTLNGLIVEYLEMLPQVGICVRLGGYPMEILEVEDKTISTVRIWPKLRQLPPANE